MLLLTPLLSVTHWLHYLQKSHKFSYHILHYVDMDFTLLLQGTDIRYDNFNAIPITSGMI